MGSIGMENEGTYSVGIITPIVLALLFNVLRHLPKREFQNTKSKSARVL